MELVFNELSFRPYLNSGEVLKDKFLEMLKTYNELKDSEGIGGLLFPGAISCYKVLEQVTFSEWASSLTNQSEKNKILALIRKPFSEDILQDEEKNKTSYFTYENKIVPIEEDYCEGLGICYSKDKIAISIHSDVCWEPYIINFKEFTGVNFETQPVQAYNVCGIKENLNNTLLQKIMYYGRLELKETDILPENKEIKLSGDHHGNAELKKFAKKIIQSGYVLEVINNIDFSSQSVNLIKKVYNDGAIDIVLHWEDAGYGMKIQTTGRNYRETEAIAEHLKDEFDR